MTDHYSSLQDTTQHDTTQHDPSQHDPSQHDTSLQSMQTPTTLSLYLPSDQTPFTEITIENATMIKNPTQAIVCRATLRKSPHKRNMERPLPVVAKFFDHRAMQDFRSSMGIPYWNNHRAEIYDKLTESEVERYLQSFRGDRLTITVDDRAEIYVAFLGEMYDRYQRAYPEGPYVDNETLLPDDIAQEEVFVQFACCCAFEQEVAMYRFLQAEQGKVIPFLYDTLVTHAMGARGPPESYLSTCNVLLLEDIPGPSMDQMLPGKAGQELQPFLLLGIDSANTIASHSVACQDMALRNMVYCERSMAKRNEDARMYGRGRQLVRGEVDMSDTVNKEMTLLSTLLSFPRIYSTVSYPALDRPSATLVMIDLEAYYVTPNLEYVQMVVLDMISCFEDRWDSAEGPCTFTDLLQDYSLVPENDLLGPPAFTIDQNLGIATIEVDEDSSSASETTEVIEGRFFGQQGNGGGHKEVTEITVEDFGRTQ